MNKGQSNTRPPLFDGKYYSRWKAIMDNLLMAEDYEIWNIIFFFDQTFPSSLMLEEEKFKEKKWI